MQKSFVFQCSLKSQILFANFLNTYRKIFIFYLKLKCIPIIKTHQHTAWLTRVWQRLKWETWVLIFLRPCSSSKMYVCMCFGTRFSWELIGSFRTRRPCYACAFGGFKTSTSAFCSLSSSLCCQRSPHGCTAVLLQISLRRVAFQKTGGGGGVGRDGARAGAGAPSIYRTSVSTSAFNGDTDNCPLWELAKLSKTRGRQPASRPPPAPRIQTALTTMKPSVRLLSSSSSSA